MRINLWIIAITLLSSFNVNAQGCSDAGICEVNLELDSSKSVFDIDIENLMLKTHRIQIREQLGIGENNVIVSKTDIGISYQLGLEIDVYLRLPVVHATGDLGSNTGLGDIYVGSKFGLWEKDKKKLFADLAFKLPTRDGTDGSIGTNDLPMPYQSSLGTFDVIARTSLKMSRWLFTVGIQVPLIHNNKNRFIYGDGISVDSAAPYFQSNNLKRGTNVLFRVDRILPFKKFMLVAGVLPIIKVTKDKITIDNKEVNVDGSQGVAFNVTGGIIYPINKQLELRTLVGMPLFTRAVRTDGLTRMMAFMFRLDYIIRK